MPFLGVCLRLGEMVRELSVVAAKLEVPEIFNTKIGRQLTIERKNKFIEQHSVAFPLTNIRIPIQHPTRGPPPGPLRGTWSPPLGLIVPPLLQPK